MHAVIEGFGHRRFPVSTIKNISEVSDTVARRGQKEETQVFTLETIVEGVLVLYAKTARVCCIVRQPRVVLAFRWWPY